MKNALFAAVLWVAMGVAWAGPVAPAAEPKATGAGDSPADLYFRGKNPTLNRQERAALAISEQWQKSSVPPVAGSNGIVKYVYGAEQPSIVCAVLQVCDVALQAGEQVNSINLGDTGRWSVEPAITGTGSLEVQHLIIKPHDVGLETSLIVTTNRRTYHLRLRSHRTQYMPQVAFTYPEEAAARWQVARGREAKERRDRTIPETGEYLGELKFDYEVVGDAPWKPVRVYNDGRKTIIQMPKAMERTEAPSLLVVRKDGDASSAGDTVLVNYRVQNDRYIVDTVFDKAVLIAGVGSNQDRVTLTKGK
jgi:type IV secretion system protein TrbG